MFGCDGKPAHVSVNVDCLLETSGRLVGIIFLVAVSSINIVGCSIMLVPLRLLVSGNLAERLTRLVPLFGHFIEICGPGQHFLPLVLFAGTSEDMKHRVVSIK